MSKRTNVALEPVPHRLAQMARILTGKSLKDYVTEAVTEKAARDGITERSIRALSTRKTCVEKCHH